ncbi:MAG: hypothetical protein EOR26_32070 [Mesorhizobium sp.]|uniref:hypothetical protein n=1 Tax=unclassified Mesorhizobium TaxID=325217 RepID=UPI000FC9E5B0|nr:MULTISPECIES: hypothetical protein [unclassified Mesorhizobium]RUV66854.1 hypothetical protein EOA78_32580 [Mesorhizobium sp. M5C.F.Cr.IN.023.01.1.1]RWF86283.1 MAG: hypothetical protein EOQ36_18510 [Mesorhizobium sp.]RWH47969.1 MAG: hypothetical protein EOQ80_12955 [Mesorhizobium sp.]RWI41564.1 MAG: hypothetical protein EOR15_32605 [Mesorhizobium sp.]RWI46046.1 MAG: hypothetical protein EOR16_35875 [Mesorhizobium sp.]
MKSIKWQSLPLVRALISLENLVVPRGGFEAKEIWLCFQIVDAHTRAGIANKNTNKIFLWIGSVPGNRSIRSMPSHPNLISEAER